MTVVSDTDLFAAVIDYHLAHDVEPVVTLCRILFITFVHIFDASKIVHWDTPLALQAYYGAFTSPQIVDDFVK